MKDFIRSRITLSLVALMPVVAQAGVVVPVSPLREGAALDAYRNFQRLCPPYVPKGDPRDPEKDAIAHPQALADALVQSLTDDEYAGKKPVSFEVPCTAKVDGKDIKGMERFDLGLVPGGKIFYGNLRQPTPEDLARFDKAAPSLPAMTQMQPPIPTSPTAAAGAPAAEAPATAPAGSAEAAEAPQTGPISPTHAMIGKLAETYGPTLGTGLLTAAAYITGRRVAPAIKAVSGIRNPQTISRVRELISRNRKVASTEAEAVSQLEETLAQNAASRTGEWKRPTVTDMGNASPNAYGSFSGSAKPGSSNLSYARPLSPAVSSVARDARKNSLGALEKAMAREMEAIDQETAAVARSSSSSSAQVVR